MKYLVKIMLLLMVPMATGCLATERPSKIVIHYIDLRVMPGRYLSCDDLVDSMTDVKPVMSDDPEIIDQLWTLAQSDRLSAEGKFKYVDGRICVSFYSEDDVMMREILFAYTPFMQIDGNIYQRDVRLFKSVLGLLPGDYLKMAVWRGQNGDLLDTVYFFYEPATHKWYNRDGQTMWQMFVKTMLGDSMKVLRSEISGNPADSGFYYRIPAMLVTEDTTDTGCYYTDPDEEVIINQQGKIIEKPVGVPVE